MILDPVSKTGTSIASQHVKYSYFDSSGARQSVLTGVNGGGVYQIQSTAGAGHAQLALDTVLLTQPGNGVLFGTDNVLASGSAGNLAIGAVGTFSNITIGTGTTGITAVGVLTIAPTSGPAELILNETGVNQAVVFYETAGSVKWQLGLNTDGSFFGYDNVHSASWLNVSTTGQVTLGEASPFSITAAGALATGGTPGLTHTCTITATQTLIFKNGLLTGGTC
jgi:hypothetical protein